MLIGQDELKFKLKIHTTAAKMKHSQFPHLLLEASPGIGKTSFAKYVASELGKTPILINCASVNSPKRLFPFLMKIQAGDIVIADEVHALPNRCQEVLYTVLENNQITLASDKESITLDVPKFTFIGCTTHAGKLNKPFLDRFILHEKMRDYNTAELTEMVKFYLKGMNYELETKLIERVVEVCRGIPRLLCRVLLWFGDYCISTKRKLLDYTTGVKLLKLHGINEDNSTENDRIYLSFLQKQGCPVGVSTISASTGLAIETIENMIEPWLLRNNRIRKTNKGRVLV
jgi:Holliday junction DNA helicase RuvB